VKTFLAELYLPRRAQHELGLLSDRMREAATELTMEGKQVSYVQTLFTPEDECCFCVFAGRHAKDVAEVCRRAGVDAARVTEAVGPEVRSGARLEAARPDINQEGGSGK
jgi:hypothetical protein